MIISGFCECKAGVKATCKHTAALYFFINNIEFTSRTDQQCQWNQPRQPTEDDLFKGKEIDAVYITDYKKPDREFDNAALLKELFAWTELAGIFEPNWLTINRWKLKKFQFFSTIIIVVRLVITLSHRTNASSFCSTHIFKVKVR